MAAVKLQMLHAVIVGFILSHPYWTHQLNIKIMPPLESVQNLYEPQEVAWMIW